MVKTYKSRALAELHENAGDLYRLGMIDKKTMQHFDRSCLTPVKKLSPATIRRIRVKADVSQAVFAAYLNVTTGVVSKWERGDKVPSGPAVKLLTLVAKRGLESIT